MDTSYFGGNFAVPVAWSARPASPYTGQRIRVADLGNMEFYWNGTVWLPSGVNTIAQSAVAVPLTGTASETTLASVTIPGGLMGTNGSIQITTLWTVTNSGNTKTLRVRFGSSLGTATAFQAPALTTSATLQSVGIIRNRGAANSQVGGQANATSVFTNSTGSAVTGAIDTTVDQTIFISGQLATTSETITLESYRVDIFPS